MMQSSRTMIRRDFRTPHGDGEHVPYRANFHDAEDNDIDKHRLFAGEWKDGKPIKGLLEAAGVEDGDEFEIIIRKTGNRPFGDRRYIIQQDNHYGPETDAQIAFRTQHGRIWNYRKDPALELTEDQCK